MREMLISFFGISEEHAAKIMALEEDVRTKKIEELRAWRECSKVTF
ncbi:hypothetical protein [Streptococcus dysgalactiae]|nr:hypothetical protein [Streptococcus dysgalactiae]